MEQKLIELLVSSFLESYFNELRAKKTAKVVNLNLNHSTKQK